MKNWTREERYRTLSESDRAELEALHDQIRQSSWRTGYHVQTVTGLMNSIHADDSANISGDGGLKGRMSNIGTIMIQYADEVKVIDTNAQQAAGN